MGKSEFAKQVDEIQSNLTPFLKENGFRKRGRTFNRTSKDGLISVINFQMGAFDPPGITYFPGLRENLYGLFTINLGVYVPEVYRHQYQTAHEVKIFVQDYHCCIRARLGELGTERQDIWWNINVSDRLIDNLRNRLMKDALPFQKHFETREAIIKDWPDYYSKHNIGPSSPPNIVLAIILATQGKPDDAKLLLESQIQQSTHSGHIEYVRSLAIHLGLEALRT